MLTTDHSVYATQPAPLRQQIDSLLRNARPEPVDGEIMAIVVPNTNMLSAGPAAAQVYKLLKGKQYESVVLIAPSRTGNFQRINICSVDKYQTPLGLLNVNDRARNELCDEEDDIYLDDRGHYNGLGVDVQLPFLQMVLGSDFDIVPMVMGDESPAFCRELGQAVSEVMSNRRTLVVACADVAAATREGLDQLQADIESFDVSRTMALLNSETVLLDGKGALLVALIAALARHATSARVLSATPPQEGEPGTLAAIMWR